MTIAGRVAGLWRYPVKSMQGEQVRSSMLTERGLLGDRAYALIDAETGRVVSAKEPGKWGNLLFCHAEFVREPSAEDGQPPVAITLPSGDRVRSDDTDVHERLSRAFARDVVLAAAAPDDRRLEALYPAVPGVIPEWVLESARLPQDGTDSEGTLAELPVGLASPPGTFFDLNIAHVLTTATLGRLGSLVPEGAVDVRRFRPNVVVHCDGQGFVENGWVGRVVRIGEAELRVSVPMMRCIMTTLPQVDLPRQRSVLQAAAAHNRVEIEGMGTWACAGVGADFVAGGRIGIGDSVVGA